MGCCQGDAGRGRALDYNIVIFVEAIIVFL
jgi:hypothetical protein